MALAPNYKLISSIITSKVFQNVTYICLQKLATDTAQLSNKEKSSPPNPQEQHKDVAGLSSSVYTTPTHDPNPESINRIASPDPNSQSSIAEGGNASPDPNSLSSTEENRNENTTTKETITSFLPAVNSTGHMPNPPHLNLPQQTKDITLPLDVQKFVAGSLPQNIVDTFYSKAEVNTNKVSSKLPDTQDNKLLLMSVELGMIPESVQLLCSELTPCKSATKVQKVNDADTIKNLITNIEEQCKLLNGVCENDYNKLFLMALELGSIPQGLQTFFNEHFFINNSKLKDNDLLAQEFNKFTENIVTREKFSVGVTSILSLLYGSIPRIFDEYLNMSNGVNDNIYHLTKSLDIHHSHNNEPQNGDNFGKNPPSTQSIPEKDTNHFEQTEGVKGNNSTTLANVYSNAIESVVNDKYSNTFTNIYSNTADTVESTSNKKNVSALESFPINNETLSELPSDITKVSGVFGMNTPRRIKRMRDPNHEISPKMTNPAPKSPYSILTEEIAISVGQPSPSIQPEESCKHSLLSAQQAPGVVKEVPIIFSQTHIDNDLTPPLTGCKMFYTDLAESKLKNEKKSVPKQFDELTRSLNIQDMKLCLLAAELGILTNSALLYCSKSSDWPPVKSPKVSTLLEQQELSENNSINNVFMVMLECGILPVGITTVTNMDNFEKCCKSTEVKKDLGVNYTHKPEPGKIKLALIPWKPAPSALIICTKDMHAVPIATQPVTVNISKYINSNTPEFLQTEKLKKYLHFFEIPLYNEECYEIKPEEYETDNLCDSKTSNLSNEIYGMNTTVVVPGDNVQDSFNINTSKNCDLCNETHAAKYCATTPAGRMEQKVPNCEIHSNNTDNLPIPFAERKLELDILNSRGTVFNMKLQKDIHQSNVKVDDEQIQTHEPQVAGVATQRITYTPCNLNILTDSEICNTSEYLQFASHIIINPKRKVQEDMKSELSEKSDSLIISSRHINYVKPNEVMDKESSIVPPDQTVTLPVLDKNNTLSISCDVGKEKANNENFDDSPEKTTMLPLLDTNDTLSVSCYLGKEKANNNIVGFPQKIGMLPVLDTNDTLPFSCNVGKEKVNKKDIVSPAVMSPALDTNDTLSVSCNGVQEIVNNKNVSPTIMASALDNTGTLSISCNVGKERPVLDTKDSHLIACSVGKEQVVDNNAVPPIVIPPALVTEETHSISSNVEKNKVDILVSDENSSTIPYKNIVSVFYAKLCINSTNSDSNKHTHTSKQDTVCSNMSHNDDEPLNFTNKAQRSIEAIVKALTDKYNNSVNKLSAHYTNKRDDNPPNTVVSTDFHMGDIFKNHIWKPITLNIWKVFDYLNNINLHKASNSLDLKRDFPQELESCDLEIYNKLNSQFLIGQINKSNIFMTSKYKYFSELCPEPFSTDPKLELRPVNEDVKLHLEKCPAGVTGPSSSVLLVCDGEVGPGASKLGEYKNPEYFSYHKESYFEAEVEMLKYRLPQPSSQGK